MIRCHLLLVLDRGYATRDVVLPTVPRVGDYVLLPGHGELGAQVFSVIFDANASEVTLQFRNTRRDDRALADGGWQVES
jgi:hypothetical protein